MPSHISEGWMGFPAQSDCSSLNIKTQTLEQIKVRLLKKNLLNSRQSVLWTITLDWRRKPPPLSSIKTPPCFHKSAHMLSYFAEGLAVLQQQPVIKLALLTPAFTAQLICSVWLNKQGNASLRRCQTARTLYICWLGAGRQRAKC